MRDLVQLVGALLVVAGAVVLTRSGWPLVAGGLVLLAAVEVPGLARATQVRRLQRDELARRRAAA